MSKYQFLDKRVPMLTTIFQLSKICQNVRIVHCADVLVPSMPVYSTTMT